MYWTIARSLGVKYEFNKYGKGAWIPNSQNGFNQQFSSFFFVLVLENYSRILTVVRVENYRDENDV